MRGFRAKYGAGILTGLMAAAVVCLAIGGYQAYSQTLQAQQELEQLKQTVRQKEDELDHLSWMSGSFWRNRWTSWKRRPEG